MIDLDKVLTKDEIDTRSYDLLSSPHSRNASFWCQPFVRKLLADRDVLLDLLETVASRPPKSDGVYQNIVYALKQAGKIKS